MTPIVQDSLKRFSQFLKIFDFFSFGGFCHALILLPFWTYQYGRRTGKNIGDSRQSRISATLAIPAGCIHSIFGATGSRSVYFSAYSSRRRMLDEVVSAAVFVVFGRCFYSNSTIPTSCLPCSNLLYHLLLIL
jgi:hypothetical protein